MGIEQRIILIDDDEDDLNPLCDYLRIFEVGDFFATTDVQTAIDEATKEMPGVVCGTTILTDYNMGKMNGYDVMKAVLERNPLVRFVFLSSMPTVPILLQIANDFGTGFFFLDKNEPDYYERVLRKISRAKASLERVMQRTIDRENERLDEEKRQMEILEAATNTLKILNRHGNTRN